VTFDLQFPGNDGAMESLIPLLPPLPLLLCLIFGLVLSLLLAQGLLPSMLLWAILLWRLVDLGLGGRRIGMRGRGGGGCSGLGQLVVTLVDLVGLRGAGSNMDQTL